MQSRLFPVNLLMLLCSLVCIMGCADTSSPNNKHHRSWEVYLGGPGRNHYSTLSEITPENLHRLRMVWSYSAPDIGQMQMNPIVVDTILYGVTSALRVVALHAATGKELWTFGDTLNAWHSTSRGVAYWEKGRDRRIFYTIGSELFALDAQTGKPILTFGMDGKIDMRAGLPPNAREKFLVSNTPGTIYKDLIIMPTRVSENLGAAPGDIMAFSVLTGKPVWTFKTIPEEKQEGSQTWGDTQVRQKGLIGAANSWAGMALDETTETLFVPTGSAAPDFDGSQRPGSNLYANCLLALDANKGTLKWHFQFTHHDLWDRDPPAPPNLLNVTRNGAQIAAVAQVTKQGYVFVFDRNTGESLFEIKETPVPNSTLEGQRAWPTQPLPTKPKPFARLAKDITVAAISPYAENPEDIAAIIETSNKNEYAPPGLDPVLLLPGYDGGAEWGGAAADPDDGILYVNSNEMPWILQMMENTDLPEAKSLGEKLYQVNCASCHQSNLKGMPQSGFPAINALPGYLTKAETMSIITNGKGMMPGFPELTSKETDALLQFLYREKATVHSIGAEASSDSTERPKYKHTGYHKFLDSKGLPAISPPWGTLHAIDLNTGDYRWSVTLGDTPSLRAKGHPPTGCENYGGPVVTQNGLLFIAGTKDGYFRIFNKNTGELLWDYQLPAASFATPAMYQVNGKQYIALACGGEKLGTKPGNQIVAFALE